MGESINRVGRPFGGALLYGELLLMVKKLKLNSIVTDCVQLCIPLIILLFYC